MVNSTDVVVLSKRDDFHAYAIAQAIEARGASCAIVETDAIPLTGGISWSLDERKAILPDRTGAHIDVGAAYVAWWRRFTGDPLFPESFTNSSAKDLAARDTRAALIGIALNAFHGVWISHPEATRLAGNKILQLAAARRCGFRIPRTLVSSDAADVRAFCEALQYNVVAKVVAGTPTETILTGRVSRELLADDRAITLCPAIYQEFIEGSRHIRINVFGSCVSAALLETEQLDWRYPLNCNATPYDIDAATTARLQSVLHDLHLRMGIFDLKIDRNGEPVFLEVNPQGQFLWLEGLCGIPLTQMFVDFLLSQVKS